MPTLRRSLRRLPIFGIVILFLVMVGMVSASTPPPESTPEALTTQPSSVQANRPLTIEQAAEEASRAGIVDARVHNFESVADCSVVSYPGAAPIDNDELYVTSPNPTGPVTVELGLFIAAVTAISEVSNTFHIEGYIDLIWCDPRLAFDVGEARVVEKIYVDATAGQFLADNWWPAPLIINEEYPRRAEALEVIVQPNGTVIYEERFAAELEANFDLTKFPFDSHELPIEFESIAWSDEFLIFEIDEERTGFSDEFRLAEWKVVSVDTHLELRQEVRDRNPFSEFVMEIHVEREWGFYLWKLLLPFVVLVMVSWVVFWMSDDALSGRMGLTLTAVLTIVAYQFTITGRLPRVPYLTLTDAVLTFSFIITAATGIVNMAHHLLVTRDRKAEAKRLDRICRVVFPLAYFLGIAALVLIYWSM